MEQLIPVHVGLLGHIDHGKTELARALSEKVSTAGLDGHPQAKSAGQESRHYDRSRLLNVCVGQVSCYAR
jgi:translation elongation factor EF-Tu-like GTPase